MASEDKKDLNFKVGPRFRRAFRLASTEAGMTQKDLFEDIFSAYVERLPDPKLRKRLRDILTERDDQGRKG